MLYICTFLDKPTDIDIPYYFTSDTFHNIKHLYVVQCVHYSMILIRECNVYVYVYIINDDKNHK